MIYLMIRITYQTYLIIIVLYLLSPVWPFFHLWPIPPQRPEASPISLNIQPLLEEPPPILGFSSLKSHQPSFKCSLSQRYSSSLSPIYEDHDPHEQKQDSHQPSNPHHPLTTMDWMCLGWRRLYIQNGVGWKYCGKVQGYLYAFWVGGSSLSFWCCIKISRFIDISLLFVYS